MNSKRFNFVWFLIFNFTLYEGLMRFEIRYIISYNTKIHVYCRTEIFWFYKDQSTDYIYSDSIKQYLLTLVYASWNLDIHNSLRSFTKERWKLTFLFNRMTLFLKAILMMKLFIRALINWNFQHFLQKLKIFLCSIWYFCWAKQYCHFSFRLSYEWSEGDKDCYVARTVDI